MIGRIDRPRPFKPDGNPGGSKKGKPQAYWPIFLKMLGDAIVLRDKGSMESWTVDRHSTAAKKLWELMRKLLPGLEDWTLENIGDRETDYSRLFWNRVYKMYYLERPVEEKTTTQ